MLFIIIVVCVLKLTITSRDPQFEHNQRALLNSAPQVNGEITSVYPYIVKDKILGIQIGNDEFEVRVQFRNTGDVRSNFKVVLISGLIVDDAKTTTKLDVKAFGELVVDTRWNPFWSANNIDDTTIQVNLYAYNWDTNMWIVVDTQTVQFP